MNIELPAKYGKRHPLSVYREKLDLRLKILNDYIVKDKDMIESMGEYDEAHILNLSIRIKMFEKHISHVEDEIRYVDNELVKLAENGKLK